MKLQHFRFFCISWVAIVLAVPGHPSPARDAEVAVAEDRTRLIALLDQNFAQWDLDHDGVLEASEINHWVANPEVRGEQAAAMAALKRASRFRKPALPSMTLDELKSRASSKPVEKGSPDLVAMFAGSKKRIEQASRELFTPEGPRIETIRQGRMGNCFSLAPLAALAHLRPDYIRTQMIRPVEDHHFLVKLGRDEIKISAPTDAEIALCSSNEQGGLWVNVYEKAAGEARNAEKPIEKREATGLDALARGGSAGTQLAYITGHDMFRISCKFAKDPKLSEADYAKHLDELRTALAAATAEKRLMTCGTLKTKIPGITPNHAYAILSYQRDTDTLRIWNPHGDTRSVKGTPGPENGYPMTDGLFEMPLTVFVKEFAGTAFEILPAAPTP